VHPDTYAARETRAGGIRVLLVPLVWHHHRALEEADDVAARHRPDAAEGT